MKKPELKDYGLKGIEDRPQIDVDSMPISPEEREAALEALILWQVGNQRCVAFRHAYFDWHYPE